MQDTPTPKATQFLGSWSDRMRGLEHVRLRDQTILDVGCNMGVVGYELCKTGPAFYHGVDVSAPHLNVAIAIFGAVTVPHEFTLADVGEPGALAALRPAYEAVFALAVVHHVEKAHGPVRAAQVLRALAARCTDRFFYRGYDLPYLAPVLDDLGFRCLSITHGGDLYPLTIYGRGQGWVR